MLIVMLGALLGAAAGAGSLALSGYFVRQYDAADGLTLDRGASRAGFALLLAGLAALGGYVAWRMGNLTTAFSATVVTALLFTVALVDLQVRRIPNVLVVVLAGWSLLQSLWLDWPAVPDALLGALVGGGVFLLLYVLSRGSMGAGDVKFVAATGVLVGYPLIASSMLLGIVIGGLAALTFLVAGKANRKDSIAYGPYLALGAWAVWLAQMLRPGLMGV